MSSPRTSDTFPPGSLVIPSRNRPEMLAETLRSVLAGDHVPDEVIVVDQSDEPNGLISGPDRPWPRSR